MVNKTAIPKKPRSISIYLYGDDKYPMSKLQNPDKSPKYRSKLRQVE